MRKSSLFQFLLWIFAASLLCACATQETVSSKSLTPEHAEQQSLKPSANETVRFLEERVKRNSEDFVAYNKLASEYLRLMRETGDANFLNLAARAADASLKILPPQQNKQGLAVLTLTKYSSHEFREARDNAEKLVALEPNKGYAYQILGDALMELGEYQNADNAFRKMESLGGIQPITRSAIEQRLARLVALKGDMSGAKKHYSAALKIVQSTGVSPPETVAYCYWQLGETAFAVGDYEAAEKKYGDALRAFPDYTNALASMGKNRAAQGDLSGAIEFYERAVKRLPDINFVAALGDLYKIAGRSEDAQRQYELVEQIGRLSRINGTLYNRGLAIFYADHDLKIKEAYQLAAKEYETRKDIYGADALAWTALKTGKLDEAREKIIEALRFKTKDARLFYHAGMIFNALNDKESARQYLRRALDLSPKFNLAQAETCRKTLENL